MLEINALSKAFGSVQALDGMSFHVNPGELFGFVGSNGAGKTTTMRIILGVLAADSGSVSWQGEELTFAARQGIGYMPEERGLYPKMKVGDQLVYLARLHGLGDGEAREAMEYWTDRLGISSRRNDSVQKLSLGNQQRVQLAAALVAHPKIMVLDEPFSGLDPVAVDVMSEVLQERVDQGVPVIFSSHQLELVERLCDRVGIVSAGRMVAEGTIDDLRTTDHVEYELVTDPDSAFDPASIGASVVSSEERSGRLHRLVRTPLGFDDQTILRSALSSGPVHEFALRRPHLDELYRGVVSTPAADDEEVEEPKKRSLFRKAGK